MPITAEIMFIIVAILPVAVGIRGPRFEELERNPSMQIPLYTVVTDMVFHYCIKVEPPVKVVPALSTECLLNRDGSTSLDRREQRAR